jgi:hypothetical protein
MAIILPKPEHITARHRNHDAIRFILCFEHGHDPEKFEAAFRKIMPQTEALSARD